MSLVQINHGPFSIEWQRNYKNPKQPTVTIRTTNKEFQVNRQCIVAASGHFATVFKEKKLQSAVLPSEVKEKDLKQLLNYLETGRLEFNRNRIWTITKSVAALRMEELYNSLAEQIGSMLNLNNCIALLIKANDLQLDLVGKQCINFIQRNIKELIGRREIEQIPYNYVTFLLLQNTDWLIVNKLITIALQQITQLATKENRTVCLIELLLKNNKRKMLVHFKNYLTIANCYKMLALINETNQHGQFNEYLQVCTDFIGKFENKSAGFVVGDHHGIQSVLLAGDVSVDEKRSLLSAWMLSILQAGLSREQVRRRSAGLFENRRLNEFFFEIYLAEENCLMALTLAESAALPITVSAVLFFVGHHIVNLIESDGFCDQITLSHLKMILTQTYLEKTVEQRLFQLVEAKLNKETVENFDNSFLGFFERKELQEKFVQCCLDKKNCFRIVQAASRCRLNYLYDSSLDFIVENIWSLLESKDFLQLPPSTFIEVLHSWKRPISSDEVLLFDLIERWTDKNPNERKQFFYKSLRGIRLTNIDRSKLNKMHSSRYVVNHTDALNLLKLTAKFLHFESTNYCLMAKMNLVHPIQPKVVNSVMSPGGPSSAATDSPQSSSYSTRSQTHSRPGTSVRGLCGLENLGNTCFMNSAIQLLSNVPPLTVFFLTGQYKDDINFGNKVGRERQMAEVYAELLGKMWLGRRESCSPSQLKAVISRFAPQFSGYQQQDSLELMLFLLDGLHEGLNRIPDPPYTIDPEGDGSQLDEQVAADAWEKHRMRNDSVIADLFHGQLKSRLVCSVCSKVSIKFDPFAILSLPLPIVKKRQIDVTFVPIDPDQPTQQLRLFVPKEGQVQPIYEAVSNKTNLPSNQLLVVGICSNRVYAMFQPTDSLSRIVDGVIIRVYEVLPPDQSYVTTVGLLKVVNRDGCSAHFVGLPILLSIPTTQVTLDQLKEQLAVALGVGYSSKSFVKVNVSAKSLGIIRTNCYQTPQRAEKTHRLNNRFRSRQFKLVQSRTGINSTLKDLFKVDAYYYLDDSRSNKRSVPTYERQRVVAAEETRPADKWPDKNELREKLEKIWSEVLSLSQIADNTVFKAVGGDVGASRLAEMMASQLSIEVDPSMVLEMEFGQFVKQVLELLGNGTGEPMDIDQNDVDNGPVENSHSSRADGTAEPTAPTKTETKIIFDFSKVPDDQCAYLLVEFSHDDFKKYYKTETPVRQKSDDFTTQMKGDACNLSDCLATFSASEQLSENSLWYCSRCRRHVAAVKQRLLWRLPDIVIIHLKRFFFTRSSRGKLDFHVNFPVSDLNLGAFVANPTYQDARYDLIGVTNHYGSLGGGHYTAYAKNPLINKWHSFNDSHVQTAGENELVTKAAYILIYGPRNSQLIEAATNQLKSLTNGPKESNNNDRSSTNYPCRLF